jgi:hypothetical protein
MNCEIKQYLSFWNSSANALEPLGCLTPGPTSRRRNAGKAALRRGDGENYQIGFVTVTDARPLSDGRMSGYPVVPMVDDPMKARCRGNAALHLALGGAGILHAAVARERDHLMGGAASSRAPPRPLPKCASV